jgi:hopene-associated glycosyltransferase HpnB
MIGTVTILAALALGAWFYLLLGRGMFWTASEHLPDSPPERAPAPPVAAIVPARNEAKLIARTLASLAAQDYRGPFCIVVVDDDSSDRTAELVRAACAKDGRIDLIPVRARPDGWGGKTWPMAEGVRRANEITPGAAYLWFTDADIVHGPATLSRLVAQAEATGCDLVSLMVRLHCRSTWERLLIPAFVFFFQMLYPFRRVNDPDRPEAAAAGGSMLVRTAALERIGGLAPIKGALIDDCALARAIKGAGGAVWLGLSWADASIRPHDGLPGVWSMVTRTAFDQLGYSNWALAGTVAAMLLVFVAPTAIALAIFAHGEVAALVMALLAWFMMAAVEVPTLRLYGLEAWRGIVLPVAALLYTGMTIDSAIRHWLGRGGSWKGRRHRPSAAKP